MGQKAGKMAIGASGGGVQITAAPTEENYVASLEHRASEERLTVISFLLAGREYAFEVSEAVEVLRPRQITEVPRTPEYILGILSVRGEMVPVLDLGKRLGVESAAGKPGARILVVSVEELKAGFLVDRLLGVKEVRTNDIGPSQPGMAASEEFLKGVVRSGALEALILNPAALVGLVEAQ